MRHARYEPGGQGIAARCHDDGNRSGCLLGRERRRRSSREDKVNLEPDQLLREGGKSLGPTVSRAILDHDVLSLRVSELLEPLPECRQVGGVRCGRHYFQQAHAIDLPALLRLGGERRGEEAAGDDSKERSPVHYSIT
jgi:hypothetical protein